MSDEQPLTVDDVEQIVTLSKKVSEYEMTVKGLNDQIQELNATNEKQKNDIERLQKIIADNFVATKEKPKSEIEPSKTFNDIYREMIMNNKR